MTSRTNGCCGGLWTRVGTFFRHTGRQLRDAFSCCRVRNTPARPQTTDPKLTSKKRDELAQIILQTVPSAENPIPSAPLNVLPRIQTHRPPARQDSVHSDVSSVAAPDTHPAVPEDTNQPVGPAQPAPEPELPSVPTISTPIQPEPEPQTNQPINPATNPAGAEGGETSAPVAHIAISHLCTQISALPRRFNLDHVEFVTQDITQIQNVSAIVNAAKSSLLGGSGVDRAIHNAAGPQLRAACSQLPADANGVRCPVGMAIRTDGFNLRRNGVRNIIHTVGPDLRPTNGKVTDRDREALSAAHRNVLALAREKGFISLALPAISCGVYMFPIAEAAYHALIECGKPENQQMKITFCFLAADERIRQTFIATKQALQNTAKIKR